MAESYEETNPERPGLLRLIAKQAWRIFSSMRLAVILMLIIATLSLLGALLIQVPANIAEDTNLYSQWVGAVAGNKVGSWAPLLSTLGLFDIFHSPWFVIAGTLLMLNILVCSINRWSGISASLRGGAVRRNYAFYNGGDSCTELSTGRLPAEEVASITKKVMKTRGFRTRSTSDETGVYLAADKNRFFRLGTYASHASLILFVLAFIIGHNFGFTDTQFTVAEGRIRAVGYDTDLSLQLTSFVDEYYENNRPKDYRSDVILYENGAAVKQATIQVNHPLSYKGVRFYQSYFGPAVRLRIEDGAGQELFNDGIALDRSLPVQGYQHYEGLFDLSEAGLTIRVIKSGRGVASPMIPTGRVAVDIRMGNEQIDLKLLEPGVPRTVSGLEFTYLDESQFSGFRVSKDPTNILIWIASSLFIIGICAVLYFPYRQVWILAERSNRENGRLLIRMAGSRRMNTAPELETLKTKLKEILSENNRGEIREV
ncbi:cytochrome c biogenesis protein ResB [Chloroflexota bacterium]